jgi:hypothetical protein
MRRSPARSRFHFFLSLTICAIVFALNTAVALFALLLWAVM